MGKINTLARSYVEAALGDGFCMPPTNLEAIPGTDASLCQGNQNQCTPGCDVNVTLDTMSLAPVGTNTLRLTAQVDATADMPTSYRIVFIPGSCTLRVTANNFIVTADVDVGLTAATGELALQLRPLGRPNLDVQFANCGLGSALLNLLEGIIDDFIVDAMLAALEPALRNLIANLLPNPAGIAGVLDVGNMLAGFAPGAEGKVEARILPGGYVRFTTGDGGLSLGLITGINSDRDPATRTPALDSEVARCVPSLAPPNFSTAPHSLPSTVRGTFALPPAPAFDGAPNPPGADVAIGFSETSLDLIGHHLVTSGALCLSLGTTQISQLNLGTFGLLTPSLAQLGSERRNDPMVLVTRPTRAVDFVIGDGTMTSPRLTMKVQNLELDVYAFLYERYTRAFTMTISLDVGLNLVLEQPVGMPVSIKPVLVGISSSNVRLTVQNSELLREKPAELQRVLPIIFDLLTPALGNLPSFQLPSLAGFSLQNLAVGKVSTTSNAFVSITGELGTAPPPALAGLPAALVRAAGADDRVAPVATARVYKVSTPPIEQVRAAAIGEEGALPEIVLAVDPVDALGRRLEWSWRIGRGLWRPYSDALPLLIVDRAFAFQGEYELGVMARVKDEPLLVSDEQRLSVRIDSVGPRLVSEGTLWEDGALTVEGYDVVAGRRIELAFGAPGGKAPSTEWIAVAPGAARATATLPSAEVARLADGGRLAVYLRDPAGNVTRALVETSSQEAGGCSSTSGGGGAMLLLVLLALVALRRRADWRLWGCAVAALALPACDCGGTAGRACETVDDCAGYCDDFEVPFCVEGKCLCADDIEPGKIGPYSDIAVGLDGTAWVSAYAQLHGDLVVTKAAPGRVDPRAWEWVDGVPDGPVEIENAKVRGGIAAAGPNVGMYTSIAVTKAGEPMVSYFDRETASLRFASRSGGVWTKHVVELGTKDLMGATGLVTGMYTSLTLRADDGRPGIAYLAHVKDASGTRAEVRYASAQVPQPTRAADWLVKVVDTAPVPVPSPDEPDIFPLPGGLGLFVDSARLPNQAPTVVYYDRTSGALKMSSFNATQNRFDAPVLLRGGSGNDAGWSPTMALDGTGRVHVAYVGRAREDLEYIRVGTPTQAPEIADDGYRIVGTTPDGQPRPELHFVGDDASLVMMPNGQPAIAYQDATSHELLIARRANNGTWSRVTVAGAEEPFVGAYGFFAASATMGSKLFLSTWVLDPANDDQWMEIFERPIIE